MGDLDCHWDRCVEASPVFSGLLVTATNGDERFVAVVR